jgi:hypothetical protein
MSAVATRAGRGVAPRPALEKPRLVASPVPIERIASPAEEVPAEQQQPLLLDVRGAPMAAQQGWTLAVLESLAIGRMVLHVNESVPGACSRCWKRVASAMMFGAEKRETCGS